MRMCEQWWLHCTSQWGWKMSLSDHVYCEAIIFNMAEWVKQRICIKFCTKFGHSLAETILMIQNLWATGDWQLHHDNASTHASYLVQKFFVKHQVTALQLRFGILWLPAFPKTKITFEREAISDRQWDSGKWQLGELCKVPTCLLWRGLRCHCTMYNASCVFFNKYLYVFILHGWISSGQTLYISLKCDNILKQKIFKFGWTFFSAHVTAESLLGRLLYFYICPDHMILFWFIKYLNPAQSTDPKLYVRYL